MPFNPWLGEWTVKTPLPAIEAREEGARLDRIADETLAAHREPRLQGRCGERGLHRGGAPSVFEGELPGISRAAAARRRVAPSKTDRGGQIAILDRDFPRGVWASAALSATAGHGLADVMHFFCAERGPEGFFCFLASHAFIGAPPGSDFPSRGRIVGAGETAYSRPRKWCLRVDRNDVGMRAVGAQEKSVKAVGEIPVGGVTALSVRRRASSRRIVFSVMGRRNGARKA